MILRHRPCRWIDRSREVALLLVVTLLAAAPSASAQVAGTLVGSVRDQVTGRPIPGAMVQVQGTVLSGITDDLGEYRVGNLSPGEVEVRVQRLGYAMEARTLTVPASGGTIAADFELATSILALDALVVTATGNQRRRELGNATGTLLVDRELERAAPPTLTALLQGQIPGVQIMQGAGSVGSAGTIRMRGHSSISLNNVPIIYIDGARVSNEIESGPAVGGQTTSRLNDLNLEDIESIETVRGPSAATLYGTEAAAGVVRITTKRGREGRSEWTVRTSFGGSWDATEWPDIVFNPRSFFGAQASDTLYTLNLLEGVGTDLSPWRTGLERSMGLSLTGGREGITYYVAGEWDDREGSLPNNGQTQRNARVNLDLTPSERTRVGISAGFTSSGLTLPNSDNDVFGYLGVSLVGSPWELPIVRDDPTTGTPDVETCPADYEGAKAIGVSLGFVGCQGSPFFSGRSYDDVATLRNFQRIERFTGSATLETRPRSWLAALGTLGYDQFSDQSGTFVPVDPDRPFGDASLGLRRTVSAINRSLTAEGNLTATFDLTPSIRSVSTVGGQFYRLKQELVGSTGRYFPAGTSTNSSAVITEGFEEVAESRVLGLFVQQQFAFGDRLFVTPAVRFDQSSGFSDDMRGKTYPRVMASYVISDEPWFADGPAGRIFEGLRLRGALGTSGKQPSAFASEALLAARKVTFQDQDVAGVVVTRPGNPDLRPETGREIELGFESDHLEGRLGFDFTWYHQVTKDAIVSRHVAPSTGYDTEMVTNIGEIRNRGIELGVNAVAVNTPMLRWDWRLSISTNRNEITRLPNPITFGLAGNSQRHQEGFPFGSYFSSTYEVDSNGQVVRSDSVEYVGQPTPRFDGSLATNITLFGGISLYADLGFAGGYQHFNGTEQFQCGLLGGGTYGGICPQIYEEDADGERTERARIKARAAQDQQFAPWVEDGDFLRVRVVALQILLPPALVGHFGASRGAFSLAAENLALFTRYSGVDPEVNAAGGDPWIRTEFLTLPPARRVVGRISLTF